jgi:chemosensory pili system protein ChpA (sensor histidine kinase/response regulator)
LSRKGSDLVVTVTDDGAGLDLEAIRQRALETQPGRGPSFTIRLPLDLAIVEALLVRFGGETFAISRTTIEAMSRISSAELDTCYQGQGESFTYADHYYRVMYLGSESPPIRSGQPRARPGGRSRFAGPVAPSVRG